MIQSAWRGEEGGGSRAKVEWVVGWREEGRRELGSRDAVKERAEEGAGRREEREVGAGRAAPPPPHIKCVILRIQRGYLMHKYLGHRYFIAQVFRIRILGSGLYLYLYFGYRRYPCVSRVLSSTTPYGYQCEPFDDT